MKLIPKIHLTRKKKEPQFVVIDIGLGRVNIAIFDVTETGPKFVGVGRRSFGEADTILDATLEATDALGAIVDELPNRSIIGVSGGKLETVSTIAKYTREKPKREIDKKEISSVLDKVSRDEKQGLKVFFSTVTGSNIDSTKITNPIGIKGEKAEVNCFVAYKPEEDLSIYDQIIEELELKPEKIMPSSFAVAQMVKDKIPDRAILLRVGQNKSEASEIEDGHLVRVTNFDLGTEQLEFFNFAIEAILERQAEKERAGYIWLYSDSQECNLIDVTEKLAETNWKKKFNLKEDLKIERAETEDNFAPADMGLLALALQEVLEK